MAAAAYFSDLARSLGLRLSVAMFNFASFVFFFGFVVVSVLLIVVAVFIYFLIVMPPDDMFLISTKSSLHGCMPHYTINTDIGGPLRTFFSLAVSLNTQLVGVAIL